MRVEKNRLGGKFIPANEGTSPTVNTIRSLIEQGILRATSVGFQPIKKEKLNDKASEHWGPFRFLKNKLLEASLVSVPANPNALAIAKSMNLPPDLIGRVFSKPAVDAHHIVPALHGKPAKSLDHRSGKPMQLQTLAAKIQTAQTTYTALRDRLSEIADKDDQSEEEARRADELPGEIEQAKGSLDRLLRQERALASSAGEVVEKTRGAIEIIEPPKREPAEEPRRPFALIDTKKKVDPTDYIFRALATWSVSRPRVMDRENPARSYGNDERLGRRPAPRSTRRRASPDGRNFGASNVDFLPRLMPNSIYTPLSNRGVAIPSNNGVRRSCTHDDGDAGRAWVGEGREASGKGVADAGHVEPQSSPQRPSPKRWRSTGRRRRMIIRRGMQEDTASRSIRSNRCCRVVGSRPAGLPNGVTPITASVSRRQPGKWSPIRRHWLRSSPPARP